MPQSAKDKAIAIKMYGTDRANAVQRYQRHQAINTTHQMRKLPHLDKHYNSAHSPHGSRDVHYESAYGYPEGSIGQKQREKNNAHDHMSYRQPDMPLSDAPDQILEKYLKEHPFVKNDDYLLSTDDIIGHVEGAGDVMTGEHKETKIYPPNTLRDIREGGDGR
jgi:hypothetical protein